MQAPLVQVMASPQDEEAQKTCCETHMCLLCPWDDTPLTCPESACCHADLANPAPDPCSGYFACCLNALLPGFGTCTVGCLKGSRRAKCVGFLTVALAISTALPVLINTTAGGQCTVSDSLEGLNLCASGADAETCAAAVLNYKGQSVCRQECSSVNKPCTCTEDSSVEICDPRWTDAETCASATYQGKPACTFKDQLDEDWLWPFSTIRDVVWCCLILFGIIYTFTCAWSNSIAGFLSRKPDEPREPALKFMTTVPTVNPCEAVGFGVLNCLVPGAGAVSAGAVGTENRAYGIKAGGYQMLLSTAPFLVMVMVQIALFSSAATGDVKQTQVFMGLSPIPFTMAIACYALNWLWSCLYGYLLIKHNTQLCSHFDAPATPILPVATAAGISRPTSPNGSYRGAE